MNPSIRVIDDLLDPQMATDLCYMIMTNPMYCPCDHTVDRGEADGSIREMGQVLYPDKKKEDIVFQSILFRRYFNNVTEYQSDFWKMENIVGFLEDTLKIKRMWNVRANCTTVQDKHYQCKFHTDMPNGRLRSQLTTCVYYLNSNNGGTLFQDEENTFVQSKFNRAVIFPASFMHSAVACTDAKLRFVLNMNYEEQEE